MGGGGEESLTLTIFSLAEQDCKRPWDQRQVFFERFFTLGFPGQCFWSYYVMSCAIARSCQEGVPFVTVKAKSSSELISFEELPQSSLHLLSDIKLH